ncbi:putative reverse transcriptase domain-containing protein [Tanacetum coccineum]
MHVDVPALDVIRDMVAVDPYFSIVLQGVQAGEKPYFFLHDGFLFKGNQLCIPDSSLCLQIIKELHGEGHVGRDSALCNCACSYFGPNMEERGGSLCQEVSCPWIDISMDFVLGLPRTQRVNVAQLFFRDVYRLHGLPSSIVSDRDTRNGWATEVVNRSFGNLLRCLVGDHVKAWDQKLCQAEFAHNHAVNRSTSSCSQESAQILLHGSLMFTSVHENFVSCSIPSNKQDADHKRRHVDFEEGDFVWAVLTKDCFLVGEYNKLSAKKIGLLEIHLVPYHGDSSDDDLAMNSRTNFIYLGGNDGGPSIKEQADLFLKSQDRVKKRASVNQP